MAEENNPFKKPNDNVENTNSKSIPSESKVKENQQSEKTDSLFSERVNQEEKKEETIKKDSPFANIDHKDTKKQTESSKPKKKITALIILATFFITIIAFVVLMIFVLATGGPNNPALKTFGIDPVFLKESLIQLTNIAFGSISFLLFLLLVFGVFRGLMTKKEDTQKKKSSFILSMVSFIMIFLTLTIWFALYNYISKFVVNAEPPAAEIIITPSQEEILKMKAPIELTLSASQAKKVWERKRKQISKYKWDLNNDGVFEFETNEIEFVQEINKSGEITISLMVEFTDNSQTPADIVKKTIKLPQAMFDYNPKKGEVPLTVEFNAGKFNDPQNPIAEYSWDFNSDNEFDIQTDKSKIKYTFDKIGAYTVLLRTKSITGTIEKYFANIEVFGSIATTKAINASIAASPSLKGTAPFTVRFSGEQSSSANGQIIEYLWDFGDGSLNEKTKKIDHTFIEPGEYEVVLKITNETKQEASTSEKVFVYSKKTAPVAKIKNSPEKLSGIIPFSVKFDASESEDKDNNIVDYEWDINNDGKIEFLGQKLEYIFRDAGEYKVTLTVRDADSQEDKKTVNVSANGNEINPIIIANPESGSIPLIVNFDASTSTYEKGKIISYEWDFGDSTEPQLAGAQKSHRYTRVGQYEITLKIFTDDGKTAEKTIQIFARVAPTQACFTVSRHDGPAPLIVSFDSSCSTGNAVSWKWDFADSTISKERKPNHTFNSSGMFEVELEIIDSNNNVSTYSDVIEVR